MGKVATVNEILPPLDIKSVEAALSDITTSWRKTTEAILNTADTLYKYQSSQDWAVISEELDKRNIIKISVQKFLVGIAQNPTLKHAYKLVEDKFSIGYKFHIFG